MPEWDLLGDEPDQTQGAEAALPATSAWASLDGEPSSGTHGGSAVAWQPLDGEPDPAGFALPAPELAATQLRDGEVLWARVDGQAVTLGSGQPLHVRAGVPDRIGGWRRVRIIDAASLRAEVLMFPVEQLPQSVADDPTLLFPPDPARTPPPRPAGFPVGEGGDLSAAFEMRVRDAEQDSRQAAREAWEEAQRHADQLERKLREDYDRRTLAVERRAEARYQDAIERVNTEAVRRVEQASHTAMQSHGQRRQAERERDEARAALARAGGERARRLAVAALGWVCVLVLLAVLLAR